jgi:hypothetical protein
MPVNWKSNGIRESLFVENEVMSGLFRIPVLSRTRIWLALSVALVTDALQLALGPWGWVIFDEVADVVAMSLITLLLGFHPLLLPTFLIEFFPAIDMLPTWTACTLAVVALRRKQQRPGPVPPPVTPTQGVIDV